MESKTHRTIVRGSLALACILLVTATLSAAAQPVASVNVSGGTLSWSPTVQHAGLVLTVSGSGLHFFSEFGPGEVASFDIVTDAGMLPDGNYTWELLALPPARGRDKEPVELPRRSQSGYFNIVDGSLVDPNVRETLFEAPDAGPIASDNSEGNPYQEDQVILDDLIVDGSACIGQDCVNGESFGFDTIRLKENNLRIKFQDTSSTSSFPTRDWQLTANDSSNGGANKFSIDDIDGGRTPFTVEAGAPSHSLYVDDGGRLGFGTATPVVELHVKDGDTPTLRLEQDGSSGFTPQTWDAAGNETNFFIRDATNGSKLPFRIAPGADTSSISIASDGDVGMGIQNPADLPHGNGAALHIKRTDGEAALLVEEASSTTATRVLMELVNNGAVRLDLTDTSSGDNWRVTNSGTGFDFNRAGSGFVEMKIEDDGDVLIDQDLTVNGTIFGTVSSSRDYKHEVEPVNAREVLDRVANMPISTWKYDLGTAVDKERHLGPMAEDFHAAFGLGRDEKSISLVDYSGVALAAIKGLYQVVDERDERIERLESQNRTLLERLERIERRLEENPN